MSFQNEKKKYTLERTFLALQHDDVVGPSNDCHSLIKRDDRGGIQRVFVDSKPSVFHALGWPVEKPVVEKTIVEKTETRCHPLACTTNYVVLWNISTKPSSLWIVHDYVCIDDRTIGEPREDEADDEVLNELGAYGYHNNLFDWENHEPVRAMKDDFWHREEIDFQDRRQGPG